MAEKIRLAGLCLSRWFCSRRFSCRTSASEPRRASLDSAIWLHASAVRIRQTRAHRHARLVLRSFAAPDAHLQTRHPLSGRIIAAAILGLVFIEPDRGTTILLAAVSGSMLLAAGVRWTHLLIPAVAGAAGLAVSILHDPMRMNRILAWRHPQEHLNGAALPGASGHDRSRLRRLVRRRSGQRHAKIRLSSGNPDRFHFCQHRRGTRPGRHAARHRRVSSSSPFAAFTSR